MELITLRDEFELKISERNSQSTLTSAVAAVATNYEIDLCPSELFKVDRSSCFRCTVGFHGGEIKKPARIDLQRSDC